MAKKKEEAKKKELTFREEVLEVLRRVPLNKQEISSLTDKVEVVAKKHFGKKEK